MRSPVQVTGRLDFNIDPSDAHGAEVNLNLGTQIISGLSSLSPQVAAGLNIRVGLDGTLLGGGGSFGYGHVGRLSDLNIPGTAQLERHLGVEVAAEWLVSLGVQVNHHGHVAIQVSVTVAAEIEFPMPDSQIVRNIEVSGQAMVGTVLFDGVPDVEWDIEVSISRTDTLNRQKIGGVNYTLSSSGRVEIDVWGILRNAASTVTLIPENVKDSVNNVKEEIRNHDPTGSNNSQRGLFKILWDSFHGPPVTSEDFF